MTDDAVGAIHRNDLHGWAAATLRRSEADPSSTTPDTLELAERALSTCRSIGERRAAEHRLVAGVLTGAGVAVDPPDPLVSPAQRIELTVPLSPDALDTAIEALAQIGYRRHHAWSPGAERSLRRTSHEIVVARSDDVTRTVRLRWRQPQRRTTVARAWAPTPADWAAVDTPAGAWWVYHGLRPARLVAERIGFASRDHADLEPFLVTPTSLIGPVLDVAEVGPDDCVLDLGCGDGRIVIAAAERFGCRGLGIEQDARRAADAAAAVEQRGLTGRVRIVEGDGLAADLSDVTAATLFLPTVVARRVLPSLLERLAPGARIVLHEQSPLHGVTEPDRSTAIVTDDAVTVAHRWDRR